MIAAGRLRATIQGPMRVGLQKGEADRGNGSAFVGEFEKFDVWSLREGTANWTCRLARFRDGREVVLPRRV